MISYSYYCYERDQILGAGLSGLTGAVNLAKNGYKVDVYEKNKDVGMSFHGDIQGLENWPEKKDILEELTEMNVDIDFDCAPFSNVILTNGSKAKEISSRRPLFYLSKRGSFPIDLISLFLNDFCTYSSGTVKDAPLEQLYQNTICEFWMKEN